MNGVRCRTATHKLIAERTCVSEAKRRKMCRIGTCGHADMPEPV